MTIADQPMTERAERVIKQDYVIPHSHPPSARPQPGSRGCDVGIAQTRAQGAVWRQALRSDHKGSLKINSREPTQLQESAEITRKTRPRSPTSPCRKPALRVPAAGARMYQRRTA